MRLHRREKRFLRALRRPFEWTGVFLGYLVLSNLSRRAMLAVCDFAAGVMHFFDRRGRALALSNLRVVFHPNPDDAAMLARVVAGYAVTHLAGAPAYINSILKAGTSDILPKYILLMRFFLRMALCQSRPKSRRDHILLV